MTHNLIKIVLLAMPLMLIISACNEDLFDGRDNYIKSFSVTQAGQTYDASFRNDSILVSAPEGVSLNGAKATYELSENAKISPDPASITDWDQEYVFTVTAHNGNRKAYKYVTNRTGISVPGTVTLYTQDDVDKFGATGATSVQGNLIIGRLNGYDSIRSLNALKNLRSVGYRVIINPTYAGKDIFGLDNLVKVGGLEIATSIKSLRDVTLTNLKTTTLNLIVSGDSIYSLQMPNLESVGGNMTISARSITALTLSNLQSVYGTLTISNLWVNGRSQTFYVSLPKLESVGDFSLNANTMVIQAPLLKQMGNFSYYGDMNIQIISFPLLETINGSFSSTNSYVNVLNMPKLKSITGSLTLQYGSMGFLDLSSLTTVGGDMTLSGIRSLKNLSGLAALTSIGGSLTLKDLGSITSIDLSNLKTLNSITMDNAPKVTALDLGGTNLTNVSLLNLQNVAVSGGDLVTGTLTITNCANSTFTGFKEVNNLTINSTLSATVTLNTVEIPSLTKVNGTLSVNGSAWVLRLANLTEVKGAATVTQNAGASNYLPKLASVTGNFTYNVYAPQGSSIALSSVDFSSLKTIGGKLQISSSQSSSYGLTNLKMFASLTSVPGGVSVSNQSALTSYRGLENALASFTADKWSVATSVAYRPTYQDLGNGLWDKP